MGYKLERGMTAERVAWQVRRVRRMRERTPEDIAAAVRAGVEAALRSIGRTLGEDPGGQPAP